jgi:hypothetical protein
MLNFKHYERNGYEPCIIILNLLFLLDFQSECNRGWTEIKAQIFNAFYPLEVSREVQRQNSYPAENRIDNMNKSAENSKFRSVSTKFRQRGKHFKPTAIHSGN